MKQRFITICTVIAFLMLGHSVKAQYVLKLANEQYSLYNYTKAAELYLKAFKKDSNLYTAEHLANCYRLTREYPEAEKWYATTVAMSQSKPDNLLKYAEVLKNNLKYAEAKAQYTKYYTISPAVNQTQLKVWISSCDSAIKWMKNPVPVEIRNEQMLNTKESDWGAVKINNTLVFTSDRQNKTEEEESNKNKPWIKFDGASTIDKRIYGWTGNKYLNLYEQQSSTAAADAVKPFPFIAGTEYHIGAASFTADGTEMYFTLTHLPDHKVKDTARIKTIKLDIYWSRRNAATGLWEQPIPFTYNNETAYSVGDPFITPDGKTLYFTSDMPGGVGGTDIYYCERTDGNWSQPMNLKAINTTANERTPFVDANGTIYFSTDGDKGMGGLDIFKALRKGNTFGIKQNLGYPINSAQDDFSYVLPADGASGYLSSNRTGGIGSDDIYSFTPLQTSTYTMEGVVYDKFTRYPIANSTVTLTRPKGILSKVQTNSAGQFRFVVNGNSDYQLKSEKTGYLSDNLNTFSTTGLAPSEIIRRNLYLEKIELKKAIRIENIYYDLDKADIRPDAALELDKLISVLKDNPTIVIELGSHTDSRADDDYNMALSRRRANAAADYIINVGGIDEDRIIARGYGETRLLNRCGNGINCSEAAHQLNRRTEFTIIGY
jgi:peptidoglycan-associated lipoprotein